MKKRARKKVGLGIPSWMLSLIRDVEAKIHDNPAVPVPRRRSKRNSVRVRRS